MGKCKHTKLYNEAISLVLWLWQATYEYRKLIRISITSLGHVLLSKYSISLSFCIICFDRCESITPYENPKSKASAKASCYVFYYFFYLPVFFKIRSTIQVWMNAFQISCAIKIMFVFCNTLLFTRYLCPMLLLGPQYHPLM